MTVKTLAKENKGGVKISWSLSVGFTYFMSTEFQMFSPFTVLSLWKMHRNRSAS